MLFRFFKTSQIIHSRCVVFVFKGKGDAFTLPLEISQTHTISQCYYVSDRFLKLKIQHTTHNVPANHSHYNVPHYSQYGVNCSVWSLWSSWSHNRFYQEGWSHYFYNKDRGRRENTHQNKISTRWICFYYCVEKFLIISC